MEEKIKKLISKIETFKKGDKITLVAEDIFGDRYYTNVTFVGKLKKYGYISETVGGWALSKCDTYNVQSYTMLIKYYRCSRNTTISLSNIIDIIPGWKEKQ